MHFARRIPREIQLRRGRFGNRKDKYVPDVDTCVFIRDSDKNDQLISRSNEMSFLFSAKFHKTSFLYYYVEGRNNAIY